MSGKYNSIRIYYGNIYKFSSLAKAKLAVKTASRSIRIPSTSHVYSSKRASEIDGLIMDERMMEMVGWMDGWLDGWMVGWLEETLILKVDPKALKKLVKLRFAFVVNLYLNMW